MVAGSSPAKPVGDTAVEEARAGRSHWAIGFARLRRNPGAAAGALIVLAFVAAAAMAPWLTDDDPLQVQFDQRFAAPSVRHPLGTDSFGRDLLSRVLYGGRLSLSVGLIAIVIFFPNVLAPIVVLTTLRLAGTILSGVGVSFLGLGAQPPTPEWGAIVAEGRSDLREAW